MRNLKVAQLLALAFGALIALLVLVSLVAANRLHELNVHANTVVKERVPKLEMADKWMTAEPLAKPRPSNTTQQQLAWFEPSSVLGTIFQRPNLSVGHVSRTQR